MFWLLMACTGSLGESQPLDTAELVTPCGPELNLEPGMVRTSSGVFQGRARDLGWSFQGIPFAKAPVGALRFAPPEPAECAPTLQEALDFGPLCPQLDGQDMVGEEDCLQLNVFTSAEPGGPADRPVLVYVHGGGHTQGGASYGEDYPLFEGQELATRTGSVVVTLQYRLGILGFLALEGSPHPANAGIQDLHLGLQWVQDNIQGFGGDPNQVLLFGESAGAVNTCVMMSAPASEGLFTSALMQSGPCPTLSPQEGADHAQQHLEALACEGAQDTLACLQQATLVELVALSAQESDIPGVLTGNTFWPVADGEILDSDPVAAWAEGRTLDIPVVFGSNSEETALYTLELSETQLSALMRLAFGDRVEEAQTLWPLEDYSSPRWAWVAVSTDLQFTCPARFMADAASESQNAPVYRYRFSHRPAGVSAARGAYHGLELPYVFQTLDLLSELSGFTPDQADLEVEAFMGLSWAALAAGEDPGVGETWPRWRTQGELLHIDEGLYAGEDPTQARCDFVFSLP